MSLDFQLVVTRAKVVRIKMESFVSAKKNKINIIPYEGRTLVHNCPITWTLHILSKSQFEQRLSQDHKTNILQKGLFHTCLFSLELTQLSLLILVVVKDYYFRISYVTLLIFPLKTCSSSALANASIVHIAGFCSSQIRIIILWRISVIISRSTRFSLKTYLTEYSLKQKFS